MRSGVLWSVVFVSVACGGAGGRAVTAPSPPPSATVQGAAASAPAAGEANDPDPTESSLPIAMPALLSKTTSKSTFPKKTVTDGDCWRSVSLMGDAKKDFATVVDRCGAPTGMQEYAKPVTGRLHSKHDKRDTYTLKLVGGMCYRYFAVADGTVTDLDILVEKPGGALVADDQTTNPVAIVESSKPWCADENVEYSFHIEVDGEGKGCVSVRGVGSPQMIDVRSVERPVFG